MRLIKSTLLSLFLCFTIINAKQEEININFKDISIMDLVDITSKIVNKNILLTHKIKGKVDFISNKTVYKDDIINILIYVLESKGFTLIDNDDILRIVKLEDSTKHNAPIVYGKNQKKYFQMVTEVFHVKNINVDYVASKVKHLISKSAKLVTDKESNIIVVTDYLSNIKTLKKVVFLITQEKNRIIKVIELKNIKANDAKTTLSSVAKSVFNFKVEKEKVEVLANKENNSISIIGSKKNVKYLNDYILSIDNKGNLVKRVVEVIRLKNVEASNVIKIIDSVIGKKKYLDSNLKPYASSDNESNSIVLMGPKDEIDYITELISKLDIHKLQVYVKAKIIEVNDDLVDEVGVKYGIFGGSSGSNGLTTFSSNLNGSASDAIAFDTSSLGLSIPNISSGLALGASISLLNSNYALNIVSEPSILCINNKESSIYIGETVSVKTGTTTNSTGTSNSYTREDVGLTLKVKPRISSDNKVTLEINTILEDVGETNTSSGNADTSKKEVKTTAIVNNGESVIIGGLIQNKDESTVSKVPLLGDIPLLGNLFKHDYNKIKKRTLVVIVTPYIIPKSKDLTYVRNQLAELKMLERKFLEDRLIRIRKNKINDKKEKTQKENEIKKLDLEYQKLFEDKNKVSNTTKVKKELSPEERHKIRMKKIMGY